MDKLLQIIKQELSDVILVPSANANGKEVFLTFGIEKLGMIFSKLFSYKSINSRLRDIAIIPLAESDYKIVYNVFFIDELTSIFLETNLKEGQCLPSVTKFYKNANFLERKIQSTFSIDIKNSVMDNSEFFKEEVCIK